VLEKLAQEAEGAFRLAKVNVDDNPNLALRYGVRSLPNVKAFRAGEVIAEFVGAQPENRIREFLRALAPNEHELLFEKAQGLLELGEYARAEAAFQQFLSKSPENPGGLLGLVRCQLLQARYAEAHHALRNFPPSKEYSRAQALLPLVEALQKVQNAPAISDDPLEAAYFNALRLVHRSNYEAAMDGILDVLRQDKRFRNEEPRKVMLGIFEMLGENNPLTRQYRQELSLVLF
jgi:putative thioredoxin